MDKKIVFVHTGGHLVHRAFAKEVTSSFINMTRDKIPKNYDIYFVEAGYLKVAFLRMLGIINRKSKIIGLFSDPRLYFLKTGKYLDIKNKKIKKYPFFKKEISKFLLRKVDGGICTSHFEDDLLKYFHPKIKSKIVYPFIRPERFERFGKISPNLNTKNILFIGNQDFYYKGLDLLIDSFRVIKKKHPDSNLYVLGDISIKKSWNFEGVHFEGKKEIEPYLKKCSLYVHPGRGEAFGIAVVETMLAGIPALVSNRTGSKEFVQKVSKNLIFGLNPKEIERKISSYFNMTKKEKEQLSGSCRKVSKVLSKSSQIKDFKEKFSTLIKLI